VLWKLRDVVTTLDNHYRLEKVTTSRNWTIHAYCMVENIIFMCRYLLYTSMFERVIMYCLLLALPYLLFLLPLLQLIDLACSLRRTSEKNSYGNLIKTM